MLQEIKKVLSLIRYIITIPILTRYEKAKILGLRAKQINHGSKPFVEIYKRYYRWSYNCTYGTYLKIKFHLLLDDHMPNGGSEYWKISDLKNLD